MILHRSHEKLAGVSPNLRIVKTDSSTDSSADSSNTEMRLLKLAEALIRSRLGLGRLVLSLENDEEESPETELRSDLECVLIDHFDPLLKAMCGATGGPRGELLEAAFDTMKLMLRLQTLGQELPHSPQEEEMLEGAIPTDVPTEIRITLVAVVEDQLDLALENLLHAVRYRGPEPAAEHPGGSPPAAEVGEGK
jgi:hypothetical protein